jgi:hypothetical protein
MSNYNLLDLSHQITNFGHFGPGPICSATEASLFEETSSKEAVLRKGKK